MKQEGLIQVGVTAMRDRATGEFLPAVPLFILADDSAAASEKKLIEDIGALLADRMRRYKAACEAAGVAI